MSYLKIAGGLVVQVAVGTPTKKRVTSGRSRTGAKTGDVTETRAASRWSWDFSTIPMLAAEADSLERLLLGDFHVWDCDGTWSSSGGAGLVAATAPNTVRLLFTGPAPFTGVIQVQSAQLMTLRGNLPAAAWSALVVVTTGGVAHHYCVRSAGNYWKDGVDQGAAAPGWWSTNVPEVSIFGKNDAGANAAINLGQIVAFPWLLPDAHAKALTSWVTRKWPVSPAYDSRSPVFEVSGDFLDRAYASATAKLGDVHVQPVAAVANMRSVSFTLRQAELAA